MPLGRRGARDRPQPRLRHRARGLQRLAPPRRAAPAAADGWTMTDLGSTNGVKVNGRAGRRARRRCRAGRPPRRRDRRRALRGRMRRRSDPVSVALKFGFLAVLYLFLLWVCAQRAARPAAHAGTATAGAPAPAPPADATGLHAPRRRGVPRRGRARLVVERAPGHTAGMEYDLGERRGAGPRRPGRDPPRGPLRLRRHARLCARAGSSCSRTSARRTGPTSTRSCSAAPSRCTPATACASATASSPYEDR